MRDEKYELMAQTLKAMENMAVGDCRLLLEWLAANRDERMKAEEKKKEVEEVTL